MVGCHFVDVVVFYCVVTVAHMLGPALCVGVLVGGSLNNTKHKISATFMQLLSPYEI